MSSKIVLIDGHSILNRAFYGLPDLTNAEGLHTNAIYGFLTIMFKLLEEEKPEYLTVAFDVHAPTFRHKMYAEYKGTRKPMADELRQQVPVIKEVLHAMGVKTIECAGLEADDLIGTLSNRCENEGMEVTVISGDRDLLQLATEHVKIRIPKTKQGKTEIEDYYAKDVEERYQVTPKEFIDLKALMGDTADNIPGVPSIGEKTATKIITQYHSIEEAHEHVDELKPPRASKALSEHWDLAMLSKELATINVKADFPYELSEAKLGNLYTEEAYIFFQKLEFKNLLSRFDVSAPANKVEDGFKIITSKSEAEKVFVQAEEASTIGAVIFKDLENVLPLFADQAGLGGIGLCFSKEESYCIKVEKDITGEWLLKKLADVAEKAETYAMFHLKESMEQVTIRNQANCFDVSVAAYLLNPLKNNYTWEDVAREHLGLMIDEKIDQDMKACYESYVNYASVEVLRQKLRDTKMDMLFRDIEMPLVFTLFDMEQNGIRVEADALKQYGDQLAGKIAELEKEIYEEAGETFNINSPKQLGVVLFENMKLPGGRKTKTGYSTAADVLEKLAPEHPVVAKILEYRQYTKLKSTYADGLANYIQDDGRIHGKFNQTITATGRISSTEPNLQNIPVRMELGRLIRKVFIPEEGYRFVDADYSQIELRVLAHCSGDEHLIQAYKEQSDIHRITASQVFHIPFDEVTPQQRRNAKAVNFGIVYGISSFGLSQDLSITRKEAAKYIDDYFATYPGIKTFLDHAVTHAKEEGYVVTLFGRRRPVPELSSSNFMQRSFGERVAMNSPIQGAAADIIKIAMIRVNQRLKDQKMKSRLVLQVHDELLIEAYEPELDEVQNILKEEMEHAAELKVPLEIDMHTGDNWYEAK
ncbi:DNA polymerase I [Dorea longicatena]|uniref:DNA polymerase I n=1 Tax=Dorea longicatena TaxID=88431 RepID=A0AAP7ASG2_9FIRM|nr:DNA polymerase I [Dorea longicatena]NSE48661.1 DNA polymerase I [Dorea longicatena]NSE56576.1 DNA polymerase I [Dorea longicatena]